MTPAKTSNYAYVSDTDVNRMDKSVADVDLVRNLRAVIVVTNPTDAPISINARVTTPYGDYAGGGGNDRPVVRLSGPATIETTAPDTELFREALRGLRLHGARVPRRRRGCLCRRQLLGRPQDHRAERLHPAVDDRDHHAAARADQPVAARFSTDTALPRVGLWSSSTLEGRNTGASTFLRFAEQLTEKDADGKTVDLFSGGGKYLGVTLLPDGSPLSGTFTPVPAEVQEAIPEVSLEDFHIDNINYLDRHSPTDNQSMYSGSVYTIDLRRIRDAIKDLGWSVGTGSWAVVYPGLPRLGPQRGRRPVRRPHAGVSLPQGGRRGRHRQPRRQQGHPGRRQGRRHQNRQRARAPAPHRPRRATSSCPSATRGSPATAS